MESVLVFGYEAATSLVPFIVVLAASVHISRKRGVTFGAGYFAALAVFAVYVTGVFYVTGAGTIYDVMRYGFDSVTLNVNLVPFSQDPGLVDCMLNVILFMPFGILVPLIWQRLGRWQCVLAAALGLILLIEVSQLFNHRVTDIDDVLMNAIGALLGYSMYVLGKRLLLRNGRIGLNARCGCSTDAGQPLFSKADMAYQLPLFILVMFFGRFFLFNELWFAGLLYGF